MRERKPGNVEVFQSCLGLMLLRHEADARLPTLLTLMLPQHEADALPTSYTMLLQKLARTC